MGLKAAGRRKVWVGIVVFIALFCTALAYPEQSRDSGTGKQVVDFRECPWMNLP